MMRRHSEATDERGVTHHVEGKLRYVRRGGRRKRGQGGHYETCDDCQWWCTGKGIRQGTRVHPGKDVDCMSCIASPPSKDHSLPRLRVRWAL